MKKTLISTFCTSLAVGASPMVQAHAGHEHLFSYLGHFSIQDVMVLAVTGFIVGLGVSLARRRSTLRAAAQR